MQNSECQNLNDASCECRLNIFFPCVLGPCPPTDIQVSLQCLGNVGHLTWTAAPQADWYVATAKGSTPDEHVHSCSSNGTGCSLVDLLCGQRLVVTVVTMERSCMSEASSSVTFRSGEAGSCRRLLLKTLFCLFHFKSLSLTYFTKVD